jgi:hypothetical protein
MELILKRFKNEGFDERKIGKSFFIRKILFKFAASNNLKVGATR